MSNLRTELDELTDQRLDYVLARSRVNSDSQALRDAGMSRSTFYGWTLDERERLNELAQRVKREAALRAMMVIQDAAEAAAQVKVGGLKSKNEHIKQDVATEILDRIVGKALNKTEVSGKDGGAIVVSWDEVTTGTD
jgi:hypothetical protein